MSARKYRRPTLEIEAWKLTEENMQEVVEWSNGHVSSHTFNGKSLLSVQGAHADFGYYIIKINDNWFVPLSPDLFETEFEVAE